MGEKNSGSRQVRNASYEKERLAMKLSAMKNGQKVRPRVICKGDPKSLEGTTLRINNIAYEIVGHLFDKWQRALS